MLSTPRERVISHDQRVIGLKIELWCSRCANKPGRLALGGSTKSTLAPKANPGGDPRRRRTKAAIIKAGQQLFGERHPDGVGIDEIIRVSNISKQSFYNHFTDKSELNQEILRIARAEFDALVEDANDGESDAARRVSNGLCVYAAKAVSNPAQCRMFARLIQDQTTLSSDIHAHTLADINQGLKQGRLAVFSPDIGLSFVVGAGHALISRILQDPDPANAVNTAQRIVTLTLRACGLPPLEAELIASGSAERIVRPVIEATGP